MTISFDNIFPLIVPAGYYAKGTWDLPHYNFPNQSFILTWVTFGTSTTMSYLTQGQFQDLTNKHECWQQNSFENLRRSIGDHENFFTQFKMSNDGQRLIFLSFMNGDGIGSSRILLSDELTKTFPNGYYLAFPDRSCGLVISKDITDKELAETKTMIKGMFQNATTSMSGQLHLASDFSLPERWTQPIDTEFSVVLTNEILKLRSVRL
jgi:hypothetical protein